MIIEVGDKKNQRNLIHGLRKSNMEDEGMLIYIGQNRKYSKRRNESRNAPNC